MTLITAFVQPGSHARVSKRDKHILMRCSSCDISPFSRDSEVPLIKCAVTCHLKNEIANHRKLACNIAFMGA